MRLAQILSLNKTIQIEIGEDKLSVTYKPGAITAELVDRFTGNIDKPGEAIIEAVIRLVAVWDLLDDNGAPYPLTPEALAQLPFTFLRTVTDAISEDSSLDPKKRATSRVTSSLAA